MSPSQLHEAIGPQQSDSTRHCDKVRLHWRPEEQHQSQLRSDTRLEDYLLHHLADIFFVDFFPVPSR